LALFSLFPGKKREGKTAAMYFQCLLLVYFIDVFITFLILTELECEMQ